MRAIFGLVGILAVIGVIVWWMSQGGAQNLQNVAATKKKATEQASQIAGRDSETREAAYESVELEGVSPGGKLVGILVVKINPGGAYERYFGLKRNDTIVAIEYQGNRQHIRDINDEDMAKTQVFEAYRHKGKVIVARGDEKELALPAETSAKPSGSGEKPKDEMQRQIDVLEGIPGVR
jgi:hypothetical protein